MDMLIKCSDLVKRQVKGSSFSHSDKYSFEEIEKITESAWQDPQNRTPGYRDGVILVRIPAEGFVSGIVPLKTATKTKSRVAARQIGEEPYLQVCAKGARLAAEQVDIVLYSREVLSETRENTHLEADYEIVSINVAPMGGAPMQPYTMARNQLQMVGGTKGTYDSDTWAKSVAFWHHHALAMPDNKVIMVFRKVLSSMKINLPSWKADFE